MERLVVNRLEEKPEIFHSIQGEGRNIGKEATFIRLKACNLNCSFCDSRDSWDITDEKNEGSVTLEVDRIINQVTGYESHRLVITGGEPLLQQKNLPVLIDQLKEIDKDYQIEVETNGTITPSTEMIARVNQWNISPKLSNSGIEEHKRITDALKVFSKLHNADFKFVVNSEQDIEEICKLADSNEMRAENIFVMPMGKDLEELNNNEEMVKALAEVTGFNFTTREHIKRFGAKRGV